MSNFTHLLNHHTSLELQLEKTTGEPVEARHAPIRELHRPYECPADLLPYLAYHRGVDFWKDSWPEAIKRDVINASVAIHRKKGTRLAVKAAIAATGVDAEIIVDKDNPQYVPHSVKIQIDAETNIPTSENIRDIRYQVEHTNATRSSYDIAYKSQITANANSVATTLQSRIKTHGKDYLKHAIALSADHSNVVRLNTRTKQAGKHYTIHRAHLQAKHRNQSMMFTRIREAAA